MTFRASCLFLHVIGDPLDNSCANWEHQQIHHFSPDPSVYCQISCWPFDGEDYLIGQEPADYQPKLLTSHYDFHFSIFRLCLSSTIYEQFTKACAQVILWALQYLDHRHPSPWFSVPLFWSLSLIRGHRCFYQPASRNSVTNSIISSQSPFLRSRTCQLVFSLPKVLRSPLRYLHFCSFSTKSTSWARPEMILAQDVWSEAWQ